MAEQNLVPPAWQGKHAIKELPFDPSALRGLSERLLTSHWQNNYGGAVKRLNLIEEQIAGLSPDAPPFMLGALKREELIATNSMVLHELYFANLGGSGAAPAALAAAISRSFGDYASWEREFKGIGAALGGGSGWVVLNYHLQSGLLRNSWAGDHTQNLAHVVPLLVMDMYEHSYAIDYGANAGQYIAAFMDNVQWQEVARRLEQIVPATPAHSTQLKTD
jgi:Fe-Mn family superoxide dismutase